MSTHFHYLVWAAEKKEDANFVGVTYVDVLADDARDALKRAEGRCKGLNKKVYWLQNITECHDGHER